MEIPTNLLNWKQLYSLKLKDKSVSGSIISLMLDHFKCIALIKIPLGVLFLMVYITGVKKKTVMVV